MVIALGREVEMKDHSLWKEGRKSKSACLREGGSEGGFFPKGAWYSTTLYTIRLLLSIVLFLEEIHPSVIPREGSHARRLKGEIS